MGAAQKKSLHYVRIQLSELRAVRADAPPHLKARTASQDSKESSSSQNVGPNRAAALQRLLKDGGPLHGLKSGLR